jgi:activator of HSP90 ATPase
MTYAYTLSCTLPASPGVVYETWLDSAGHSAMTGALARVGKGVGAYYSAWDGYIIGKTLELVPSRRIVQSWRTTDFADDDPDSTVAIELEATKAGALLTLTHTGVPDDQTDYEKTGWREFYFSPMKAYFSRNAKAANPRRKKALAQTGVRAP